MGGEGTAHLVPHPSPAPMPMDTHFGLYCVAMWYGEWPVGEAMPVGLFTADYG